MISPDTQLAGNKITTGFVGNWDNHSLGKIHRYIAHADRRMEIVGRPWKVIWEIDKEGTLFVEWGKKKPSIYHRKGDHWVGKSPYGQPLTFKRGNWYAVFPY